MAEAVALAGGDKRGEAQVPSPACPFPGAQFDQLTPFQRPELRLETVKLLEENTGKVA